LHPLDLAKYNEFTGISDYNDNAEVKTEPAETSNAASVTTHPQPFAQFLSLADSTQVNVAGKPTAQKNLNDQFKLEDTEEPDVLHYVGLGHILIPMGLAVMKNHD
jgi:hypothetical protein